MAENTGTPYFWATAKAWFWRFRMKWHTVWCIRYSSGASVWCRIKLGPLKSILKHCILLDMFAIKWCWMLSINTMYFKELQEFRILRSHSLFRIFSHYDSMASKWFHNRDRCLVYKTDIICEIYNMQHSTTSAKSYKSLPRSLGKSSVCHQVPHASSSRRSRSMPSRLSPSEVRGG